jgi:nicotinamidase-related amidase
VVVDVQHGFHDPWWGAGQSAAEANIEALAEAFATTNRPSIYVRRDSHNPDSPLHPSSPGHRLKQYLDAGPRDHQVGGLLLPPLDRPERVLRARDIEPIVLAGITTNPCCEITARVRGNLGYDVSLALDATHTFDRTGPDGRGYPR